MHLHEHMLLRSLQRKQPGSNHMPIDEDAQKYRTQLEVHSRLVVPFLACSFAIDEEGFDSDCHCRCSHSSCLGDTRDVRTRHDFHVRCSESG